MKAFSIHRQISRYLQIVLPIVLFATTLIGSVGVLYEISEASDTHMSELAKRLASIPFADNQAPQLTPNLSLKDANQGLMDNKNMAFSIWNPQGNLLLSDGKTTSLSFPSQLGFLNIGHWWRGNFWRVYYVKNTDNGLVVGVATRWSERYEALQYILLAQLLFAVLALPILFVAIRRGVRKGLYAITSLSQALDSKKAGDLRPLDTAVAEELKPMVASTNALLARLDAALKKEQRFTADAAHELRSPLAGLRVQSDVLALNEKNDAQLARILTLQQTLTRTSHLVEQLLMLSRLDPMAALPHQESIAWEKVVNQVMQAVVLLAREKHIQLQLVKADTWEKLFPLQGEPLLIETLLRNVLDNAIRYSPEHSQVTLHMSAQEMSVVDNGGGVAAESLPKLQQRFFRGEARQNQLGSGLGLSIVARIAALHGLKMTLANTEQGFKVTFTKALA